jgi:DNA-binding CsgD family transcriptional regulator
VVPAFDAALSRFLLDLHGKSHQLGYRVLQRVALDELRTILPFDSALFGVGTIANGHATAHDVFLYEQPDELMASWEAIKHEDPLAFAATASPGTTIRTSVDSELYAGDGHAGVRAHCKRFGLEHLMCTAHVYAEAGLFWVMSLYRNVQSPAFSEEDRMHNELLSTHLFAATRNARIRQLRRSANVGNGPAQLSAIASTAGLVLDAEPGFAELMRMEWPLWIGPQLPAELADTGRYSGTRVVIRMDVADGTRLLHVRPKVAADDLTSREREVAEGFAQGESHREIGERLQIAPATVRRHLANLYEKLGVSSKAELDRMLRDAD